MILEYNILWFENRQDFFELSKPIIEKYLTDLGFNPSILYYKDDRELGELTKRKDIDLILIDQNLRFNVKGDDVITALRNEDVFTEVVLYSQYRDYEDEIEENLDGVYFTDREHLEEKAERIIDMTLRRDLDISNVRGIFIAETIYATSQMEDLIAKILKLQEKESLFLIEQMQDENFNDFLKYKIIKRYLNQEIKQANVQIAAAGKKVDHKLQERRDKLEKIKTDFDDFQEDIIEFRNSLAHAKKSPNKKNVLVMKNKNSHNYKQEVFDSKYCKEKRCLFMKYSALLQEISTFCDS